MSASIYQALASALIQEIVVGSNNVLEADAPAKPIVLLNAFPVVLDPNDYANAYSTANPNGDLRSLWRFRQLVDPLPQFAQFYMPSGLSTESTYAQIVQGAVVDGDNTFASTVISNARQTIQYQRFSNMDGTAGTWNPVYAVPEDWSDIAQLDRYNELAFDLSGMAGNGVGTGAVENGQADLPEWRMGNSAESPSIVPLDTGSKIHSVRVKYLMVNIIRPWFNALLFATDGWYLSGQQRGFCSSGQNDGKGILPLVPTGLIVGSDVTIEADWDSKDRQLLDDAKSAQRQLSLGPLLVNPGPNNLNLHIIGWGMSLIPFSPLISKEKAGAILVKNSGAFVARFSVEYEQSGRSISTAASNFPALAAKNIVIPPEAANISVKIEVMTLPEPFETWSTVAIYKFDNPAEKCYELSGTTLGPHVTEVQCP